MNSSSRVLADSLASLHRGDADAMNELIEACQTRLQRLSSRLLQSHPECRDGWGDTNDLVQEASISLWRALCELKPDSERHLYALAALQVRRRVIDLARKFSGPRSPVANRDTNVIARPEGEIVRSDNAVAPLTDAESLEDWARFHAAVDELPKNLGEVFSMRFYLGAGQEQIAATFGCDVRTVRRRWRQAVEQIQQSVEQLP